ncbi:MAG TPA: hypothetical protein VJ946_08200, partial [Bacteroidales bacterium]|nr:hypothetical protein [Bacteroidales bacterium]
MTLRNTYVNLHPSIRLMIVFALVFIGLFISQIISGIILYSATSSEVAVTEMCIENVNVNLLKIIQVINSLFTFLLPAYVIALISNPDPVYHLKMRRRPDLRQTVMTIALIFSGIALINMMAYWNSKLDLPQGMESLEQL